MNSTAKKAASRKINSNIASLSLPQQFFNIIIITWELVVECEIYRAALDFEGVENV